MKRAMLMIAVGALMTTFVVSAPPPKDRANGNQASISCYLNGSLASSTPSGTTFEIRGTNFKTWSPAWVCIVGRTCERAQVDGEGSFSQIRTITSSVPYTYRIEVYQWANRSAKTSELAAVGEITVGN